MARFEQESARLRLPFPEPDDEVFIARLAAIAARQAQEASRPVASRSVRVGSAVVAVALVAGGGAYATDLLTGPSFNSGPRSPHNSQGVDESPAPNERGPSGGASNETNLSEGPNTGRPQDTSPHSFVPSDPESSPSQSSFEGSSSTTAGPPSGAPDHGPSSSSTTDPTPPGQTGNGQGGGGKPKKGGRAPDSASGGTTSGGTTSGNSTSGNSTNSSTLNQTNLSTTGSSSTTDSTAPQSNNGGRGKGTDNSR